jgi:hypothetical protein
LTPAEWERLSRFLDRLERHLGLGDLSPEKAERFERFCAVCLDAIGIKV